MKGAGLRREISQHRISALVEEQWRHKKRWHGNVEGVEGGDICYGKCGQKGGRIWKQERMRKSRKGPPTDDLLSRISFVTHGIHTLNRPITS